MKRSLNIDFVNESSKIGLERANAWGEEKKCENSTCLSQILGLGFLLPTLRSLNNLRNSIPHSGGCLFLQEAPGPTSLPLKPIPVDLGRI